MQVITNPPPHIFLFDNFIILFIQLLKPFIVKKLQLGYIECRVFYNVYLEVFI